MASNSGVCGICDRRNLSKPSVIWCAECDEGLCLECKEHHALSKGTRDHTILPQLEFPNLEVTHFCSKHNMKYQLFCQIHWCSCCSRCIAENHSDCGDFADLNDVIQNKKINENVSQMITVVAENLKIIRKNRQENVKAIAEQRNLIQKEIERTREQMNSHLDKLQNNLLTEINEIENTAIKKVSEGFKHLDEKENDINKYRKDLMDINQQTLDYETVLTLSNMKTDIENIDKYVRSLLDSDFVSETKISCRMNTAFRDFPANICKFGDIFVSSNPQEITLIDMKSMQGDLKVAKILPQADRKLELVLKQTYNIKKNDITGCCLLPDGSSLFIYTCKKGKQFIGAINKDGSKGSKIKLPNGGFDLSYNEEDNTVAVTARGVLDIVDTKSGKLLKSFNVRADKRSCYGITRKKLRVYFCAANEWICVKDLNNEGDWVGAAEMKISEPAYVAISSDAIYITNTDNHTVSCCDFGGKTKWEFKDEKVLKCPMGISIDDDGNLYVVGRDSNNLILIYPDGNHRQLLSSYDGLSNPQTVHCDKPTNQLLIANQNDTAYLYQVSMT